VAVRQHQRIDAKFADFGLDPLQLVGFKLARELLAVQGDGGERRRGPLGPYRVDRIDLDLDQLRAGLGAGRAEFFRCCSRMQPGVEAEPVTGADEPVKPVSQASRSSEGGTYSFCCWSARGTTNPLKLRFANSSRKADKRALKATPASGSSNVWNSASNIMGY
jgi:hypothetical protein